MSRILQLRRGNSAEHENFTGQIGEITMDTDSKSLRIHDGETPGGTPMARRDEIPDLTLFDYVVEWQMPTAENNHTWYRKYKSGWVEMGGRYTSDETMKRIISLPLSMADTNYSAFGCLFGDINDRVITINITAPNTITAVIHNLNSGAANGNFIWHVCGFGA